MLTKTKMAVATALFLGSVSASLAQAVIPEYDADANPIPGQYDVLATPRPLPAGRRSGQPVVPPTAMNGPAWQKTFDAWLQ
jgi:hypothetical protein